MLMGCERPPGSTKRSSCSPLRIAVPMIYLWQRNRAVALGNQINKQGARWARGGASDHPPRGQLACHLIEDRDRGLVLVHIHTDPTDTVSHVGTSS